MKVGVFLHEHLPEAGGGYTYQEEVVRALVECAAASRHDFTLFCKRPESISWASENDRISIAPALGNGPWTSNLTSVPDPPSLFSLIRGAASTTVRRLIFRPVQHLPSFEEEFKKAGVEFLWFLGTGFPVDIPYLAVVWDLQHRLQPWFPEVSENGEWDSRERLYARVLRRASIITTGTNAGREEIERFYQVPASRIRILPLPTPRFASDVVPDDGTATLSKYGVPTGYLFYPAQFWAHKNHVNLLLAVRELRDEHGLILPVVFVGSDKGNMEHVRRRVGELGLTTQVHFLGFVPQVDLITLYRKAFALIYVTFFGPDNLPPLEAFTLQCPVVASDVSGAREQLGEAALLVDPTNPHEIANAVKFLYDDPELRHVLIERGLERASRWTGRDFVTGIFSILDEFETIRHSWGQ